jgi:hypothetical protein
MAGTQRALLADMHDADAIEAIHFEQLATIPERLLRRRGRVPKHLPSASSSEETGSVARGSHPSIAQPAAVQAASTSHPQVLAITMVIPTLVGLAIGLAILL